MNNIHPVMEAALRPLIRSEDPVKYRAARPALDEDSIIEQALAILHSRLERNPCVMDSPKVVGQYLAVRAAGLEREEFTCVWLDASNRVIETETVSVGTLTQASVYPREIVKAALRHNAAGVIFSHNHPSGSPDPSRADEMLTQTLKSALNLIDVRVLDHIIVGGGSTVSFAERGLL